MWSKEITGAAVKHVVFTHNITAAFSYNVQLANEFIIGDAPVFACVLLEQLSQEVWATTCVYQALSSLPVRRMSIHLRRRHDIML